MSTPIRQCAGCRGRDPIDRLVRLAWDDQAGAVVVDQRRRLPGRGVNLHPACLAPAIRNRAIGRGLRRTLTPTQLAGLAEGLAASGENSVG